MFDILLSNNCSMFKKNIKKIQEFKAVIYIFGPWEISVVITFILVYTAGFCALKDYNSDQNICATETWFDYCY